MSHIKVCLSVPGKDYMYVMSAVIMMTTVEKATVVNSIWFSPCLSDSKCGETINFNDSIGAAASEITTHVSEGVGEHLLTAKCSHNFKLGDILFTATMLDLNCNRPSEGALWFTAQPEDGTNQMWVLRELILASKRSLDVDSTLLHALWQAVLMNMKLQTKAFPLEKLTMWRMHYNTCFPTFFYTA